MCVSVQRVVLCGCCVVAGGVALAADGVLWYVPVLPTCLMPVGLRGDQRVWRRLLKLQDHGPGCGHIPATLCHGVGGGWLTGEERSVHVCE